MEVSKGDFDVVLSMMCVLSTLIGASRQNSYLIKSVVKGTHSLKVVVWTVSIINLFK